MITHLAALTFIAFLWAWERSGRTIAGSAPQDGILEKMHRNCAMGLALCGGAVLSGMLSPDLELFLCAIAGGTALQMQYQLGKFFDSPWCRGRMRLISRLGIVAVTVILSLGLPSGPWAPVLFAALTFHIQFKRLLKINQEFQHNFSVVKASLHSLQSRSSLLDTAGDKKRKAS